MKKILFVLTTILIVSSVVCSCSKDEDDGYSIVGVWKAKNNNWIYQFTPNGKWYYWYHVGEFKESVLKETPRESGTFTFDGTYLVRDSSFKELITFSEDGKSIKWNNFPETRGEATFFRVK